MWRCLNGSAGKASLHNSNRQHQKRPFETGTGWGIPNQMFLLLNLINLFLRAICSPSSVPSEDVHPLTLRYSWNLFLEAAFLLSGSNPFSFFPIRVQPGWRLDGVLQFHWHAWALSNFWEFFWNVDKEGTWSPLNFPLQMFKFSSVLVATVSFSLSALGQDKWVFHQESYMDLWGFEL